MDDSVRNRLAIHALSIEDFRNLDEHEQRWLFPLLSKSVRTTIEMLDLISEQKLSFEEIATMLSISHHTVTQKLNALLAGGMTIDMSETTAYCPTGRPRKLARKSNHEQQTPLT